MKNIHKKIIILLCLALFCGIFTGCHEQLGDPNSTAEGPGLQEPVEPFIITKESAGMAIWLDGNMISESSNRFQNMVSMLADFVEDKIGLKIQTKSDKKYNAERDAEKPGILIGKTVFAESKKISELQFKQRDYYVGILGNKLVVYGETEEACLNALTYLYQDVFLNQDATDGTLSFLPENILEKKQSNYGIDHITVGNVELCDFRIVISKNATANELYFAHELRNYLTESYGYQLKLVTDETSANGSEILIGNTNRSNGSTQRLSYNISETDGNISFHASDMLGYEGLLYYIKNTLWKPGRMKSYTMDAGFFHTGTPQGLSLDNGTLLGQQSYGDVRCMFYNVFGWDSEAGPIALRQEMQIEIIKAYQPDVMAFQEFTTSYSNFPKMLSDVGYSKVEISGASLLTPLFYNSSKLCVRDSGYLIYSGPNDLNSKSIVWAEFEVIASGKRFICMSTHFMWDQPEISDPNAVRVSNAQELVNLIAEIQSDANRNNIPLLVGGDLNCGKTSEPAKVLTDSGLLHAWDQVDIKNNSSGHHGYSTYDNTWGYYTAWDTPDAGAPGIDHVYVTTDTNVKAFVTLTDNYSLICSDHCPILVDFIFN